MDKNLRKSAVAVGDSSLGAHQSLELGRTGASDGHTTVTFDVDNDVDAGDAEPFRRRGASVSVEVVGQAPRADDHESNTCLPSLEQPHECLMLCLEAEKGGDIQDLHAGILASPQVNQVLPRVHLGIWSSGACLGWRRLGGHWGGGGGAAKSSSFSEPSNPL